MVRPTISPYMKTFEAIGGVETRPLALFSWLWVAFLLLVCVPGSYAYPLGRTTFYTDPPFAGTDAGGGGAGSQSLAATNLDSLFTVAAWADTNAAVPAVLSQWFWLLGVDSGAGNYALVDGTESMTLQFDRSVGAAMLYFLYTGGTGGATNNLARISISGFKSNPVPVAVTWISPRISNFSYTNGTLSFDYLSDSGSDFGQVMFGNTMASAGRTLTITGAVSSDGDSTSWGAALYRVDIQGAFAGPQVNPINIPSDVMNTYTTSDGSLTIRGYSDTNATLLSNLGTYQDECFGLYGSSGGDVVNTSESITLQFANGVGLSRLDSVYSSGTVIISGFLGNPGFSDPSANTSSSSYSGGVLTFTLVSDSPSCNFYFTNRFASAGQTLRINAIDGQFGVAGIGYVNSHTLLAPDIPSNISPSYSTPDGFLTLTGYSNTPGTVPANLCVGTNRLGIVGGNYNDSIDGEESLKLQFASGTGISGFGTRYTSGQVIISGFTSDPGFSDPSGIATDVSYSGGTLSYTFNAPHSPEIVIGFTNVSASLGTTLSMHTDGNPGSQIDLTRINYATSVPPVVLSISRSGGSIILNWPNGTLQQSTNVAGIYGDVIGATNPYTNLMTGAQMFFRVKMGP